MAKSVKIGITGLPGSGKTEALEKVIGMLEADQKTVGGMVTKPMFDQHRLVGDFGNRSRLFRFRNKFGGRFFDRRNVRFGRGRLL